MNAGYSRPSWVCPQHENSSLEACRDAGCAAARLAGAAPELLATLAVLVEAHDNPDPLMPFEAYIRHARAVIARARPAADNHHLENPR